MIIIMFRVAGVIIVVSPGLCREFMFKEFYGMVKIGNEEAEYLRKRFPNLNIVRTMKAHSQRHRYYVEESMKVLNALKTFEKGKNVYEAAW